MLGQSSFSLFTIRRTRDRFKFERTCVSAHGYPVFEKNEDAGMLSRNFISFHCLENESNVLKDRNTESTENYPDLPQGSESEIVVVEETETSPRKKLAVLQVTGGKETMVEETGNTNKESLIVSSQECLLSSSDEGREGLEKFLRDKLESFGGEGLEKIVEVDPAGVLELLDANLVNRGNTGSDVAAIVEEIPRSRVDDILRSELQEKQSDSVIKRPLGDVDVSALGEVNNFHSCRGTTSVAVQFDDAGGRLSSGRCEVVGVSDSEQSFPSSSRPDDTEYGTSELESIARKRVGDVNGKVCEAAGFYLPCSSRTSMPRGMGAGRSKYYPSESARTLLKECFADNPPVQLDPHQQLTGMSSDQMIQFARAVRLEVSLATFGMLDDALVKIGRKAGRNVGYKSNGQSGSISRAGSTVVESVASRSFYSLPTITESFGSDRSAGDVTQQSCSSRQADAALDFSRTEVTEIKDTDSLKTLGHIRFDARK